VRDVPLNTTHNRWTGRGEPTARFHLKPALNLMDLYAWGQLNPLRMETLWSTKRHFTIAL
jgi:hypothetical protein